MLAHVHTPTSLDDALSHLRDRPPGTVRVLAGGTEVMPAVNAGTEPATELLSLRRVGLAHVSRSEHEVTVGATTPLADLASDPRLSFLAPALGAVAAPPVRTLATIGGNLFAAPPYGDLAACLLALDARAHVAGPAGVRVVAVEEVIDHGVAEAEILTRFDFRAPAEGTWFFHKAARRRLNSAAVVTVTAHLHRAPDAPDHVASARIALNGVAERPWRARAAERALAGRALTPEAVLEASAAVLSHVVPRTDAYASGWYRARVLPTHMRRALLGA
ncbi:FAD binding domain-containing protein [Spiractinospora alimapuensis]|uniref:FAD binding domain-containing protein n=1 Tax=Spiractinospora alimapuensis TaxID=2820884 RepID=UPI001F2EC8D6|nr:FAD binding domain-containing protein [Spiractinospora alimapuensis]QVQ53331.1 FAD binding domain-containing protein [Spiractinospora alimapuensis]